GTVFNPDQSDVDGDGIGDACDAMPNDGDNDGTDDGGDNCPATANADQSDVDGDGIGDACDAMPNDGDNDGIGDARDNCRATPNANQNDADGDGIGDACDDPYSPQDEVILPLFRTTTGKIVPATGGGAIELDCQLPYMILRLANGDEAIFRGLCGYRATLDAQPVESIAMLEPLPEEGFASGMMVSVLKEEKPVDPLPDGGMVTVSFLIPQAWQGKQLTILYWDPALNGGKGDWMALPDQVTSQGVVMPEVLNPGDGGDARWVYSGVENTGSRVEATLNFSGVFTLVEK
ncbi:MAG: hypothetical protein HPY76_14920, partial [Anaerolineae bacterium]|nr:hypothetical protein [Anaerolineae bacterium]